ncbi:MAG: ribonuclease J [bacterium]
MLNKKNPTLKKGLLRVIPLGSNADVQKNLYVYEYDQDIMLIDCGIGFPESEALGVDIVIPDFTYLKDKAKRIRGLVLTHAHEDHYGAVPFLLRDFDIPIYASKLALGFVKNKLEDYGLKKKVSLFEIDPQKGSFNLGVFKITPFRVNHSIPEALGLSIETPVGVVFHVADFKFDWSPVDGKTFDVDKATMLARGGVRLLLSDCLGATTEGYTRSELGIEKTFNEIMDEAVSQVFITTISSNISRIQQAINASIKHGRRVVPTGLSIKKNVETAIELGYLKVPKGVLVDARKADKLDQRRVTYVITGCYGQKNSGLGKLGDGENKFVTLQKNATVVFSADPIPGVHDAVDGLIDKLTMRGANVVYGEVQDNLHVSGHGSQGDLLMLASLVRPKYYLPIGGGVRHMRAYAQLVGRLGVSEDKVFEVVDVQVVEVTSHSVRLGEKIRTAKVYVDGSKVGDIGAVVIRDRQELSNDGIVVVVVPWDKRAGRIKGNIQIVSRGFVYMKESQELIDALIGIARKSCKEIPKNVGYGEIKSRIEQKLSEYIFASTKRSPVVLSVISEV